MEQERQVIGYTLEPIYESPKGAIVTHAFILCSSCGSAISTHSGPRYNALCLKCVEKLDVFNKLSGEPA